MLALVERMRAGEEVPRLDFDSSARFAQRDLAPTLRSIWDASAGHTEVRRFVLRLIWLGPIIDCADLAVTAAYAQQDVYTSIVAGRALLAAADDATRLSYAEYVKREAATVPPTVAWEMVEALFPRLINVDDLLAIIGTVRLGDAEGGGFNLDWNGPQLVERLSTSSDVARLISGLLGLAEAEPGAGDEDIARRCDQFASTLGTAALRLLELSELRVAPLGSYRGRDVRWRRGVGFCRALAQEERRSDRAASSNTRTASRSFLASH